QTVMLIGYKRGGPVLAVITLLIWVLPAALILLAFSFFVTFMELSGVISRTWFHYVHPMSVGFVVYAYWKMICQAVGNTASWLLMLGFALVTVWIHNLWVIPILFVLSVFITNLSNKRIPAKKEPRKQLNWINIRLFLIVFVILGGL